MGWDGGGDRDMEGVGRGWWGRRGGLVFVRVYFFSLVDMGTPFSHLRQFGKCEKRNIYRLSFSSLVV